MIMNGASEKKRVGPSRQVMGYSDKYDSVEQQAECDRCSGAPISALGVNGNLANRTFVLFGTAHLLICTFVPPVQQAPVCAHRPVQPELQRRLSGVGGHQTDLRQVPREERRPEGAVRQRATQCLLPRQVLGKTFYSKSFSRNPGLISPFCPFHFHPAPLNSVSF